MAHHWSQYFQLDPVSCFALTAHVLVMRVYNRVILFVRDLLSSTSRDKGPVSDMTVSRRHPVVVAIMPCCCTDNWGLCESGEHSVPLVRLAGSCAEG